MCQTIDMGCFNDSFFSPGESLLILQAFPVTSQRTEIVFVGMDDNNIGLLCLGKNSGNDNR